MALSLAFENLLYGFFKSIMKAIAVFPRCHVVPLAVPLGKVWFRLDRRHRRIALDNLCLAFGGEFERWKLYSIAEANFVQLGRVVLEIPSLLTLHRENIGEYVEFSGMEHLKDALSKDQGVLFLSAHLGNWELMALAVSLKFDISIQVLVRPLDLAPLDRVLSEIRCRTGNTVLDKDKSAGVISQLLRENRVIGILLDQNSSWYDGVYVPFFGRTACTNKGLALFALRYGAAVVPCFNLRQADNRYRIIFEAPVPLIRTGDIHHDVVANTALFNTIIEKYVRMAPDSWLWIHRRWRMKDVPERVKNKMFGMGMQGSGP